MKKYILVIYTLLIATVINTSSCKKAVLDETLTTARGMNYYTTDEGITSLVNGT